MKKLRLFALATHVAIEAILLIVLFATIDKTRMNESVFWVAWVFAFIVNLAIAVALFLFLKRKTGEWLVRVPLYLAAWGINVAYLIVGMVFMYGPWTDPTPLWIIESIITILYALVFLFFILGGSYINKQSQHSNQKVQFIKECRALCEDSALIATHPESKKALQALSESIRFSDPMSDETVAEHEKKLFELLSEINSYLHRDEACDVAHMVERANQVLARRNSLVQIRK